jgi:hypothetical protein
MTKAQTIINNSTNIINSLTVARRKGRACGVDDINATINVLKWAEMSGVEDERDFAVCDAAVVGLTEALSLTTSSFHQEGAKRALALMYSISRHPNVGYLKVVCRDGIERTVYKTVQWFGTTHLKIAEQLKELERQSK